MEIIYPDGSGVTIRRNGRIEMSTFTNCDDCEKEFNIKELRSIMVGRDLDVILLCKECYKVK